MADGTLGYQLSNGGKPESSLLATCADARLAGGQPSQFPSVTSTLGNYVFIFL